MYWAAEPVGREKWTSVDSSKEVLREGTPERVVSWLLLHYICWYNEFLRNLCRYAAMEQIMVSNSTFISCYDLYRNICDVGVKMMIMDCRPVDEYNASRIEYSPCMNIPAEVIRRGWFTHKSTSVSQCNVLWSNHLSAFDCRLLAELLFQRLPIRAQQLWPMRLQMQYVILVDGISKKSTTIRNTKIDILREILSEVKNTSHTVILFAFAALIVIRIISVGPR